MLKKVSVYEISEELGVSSHDVIRKAKELGIILKTPQSLVSSDDADKIINYIKTVKSSKLVTQIIPETDKLYIKQITKIIDVNEEVNKKPELKQGLISEVPTGIQNKDFDNDNSNKIVLNRKGLVIIKKKKIFNDTIIDTKSVNESSFSSSKEILSENSSRNDEMGKDTLILDNFPKITITIKNLKNINYLKWNVHNKKGIYGIIGENGVGKSSLITCLAQLINKETFKTEFSGVGYYENTIITYEFDSYNINWIKNKNSDNQWKQDYNDKVSMNSIDGFFESSIINGKRFNKIDNYIKNDLEYRETDEIYNASEFITKEMNYILYGKRIELYKFDNLVQIKAKRRKEKNKKKDDNSPKEYFVKTYKYYAVQLDEKKFLKEYLFSTGEYILLQLLKFLNEHINKNSVIPKLIIIDEIEIALHPLAQERLMERLKLFSEKYNFIVIFATHSFHIIEQIDKKNRFFIYRDEEKSIKVENNVNIGYLNTKLYKHQFFDYILLVEDKLAKKYLECTLNEIFEKSGIPNYQIISIGGADKVFEINRENSIFKYFGEAKVLSIPDQDKKDKFGEYKALQLMEITIPIENNIEEFIYSKYKNDDIEFIKIFEKFINEEYYKNTPLTFTKSFEIKKTKQFIKDIGCKIAKDTKNPKDKNIEIYFGAEIIVEIVKFIYSITNKSNEFREFKNKLIGFFEVKNI
ncbi:translation initiation factor IF-2 N-terminal domain-containing protein [Aliarcobacter butzleri]|uniref:translation initiation factor IF-2 N-terminal domain-containing protein n=1 Tax=Aliarcobacter butzleri TaxID=28197 RepID=UPI003B227732